MADDDWYRGDAWGRKDRERFEEKLARARPGNREQYLRIKALALIESKRRSRQNAGVELLERLLRDYPDAWQPEIAGAHSHLAEHYERRGDLPRAVDHFRQTIELERGTNVDHGASARLGALLAKHPELASGPTEAADLLAVDDASLIFRSQQFEWAVAQARLAATAGDADRAAALARGALWLESNDGPTAIRHPLVGLIGSRGDGVARELKALADAGDAEAASSRVEEFRRPDGTVEWHWALTESLGAPAASAADAPDGDLKAATNDDARAADRAVEAADDAVYDEESRALLAELRAAGFADALELAQWTGRKLGSAEEVRRAAPILLRWLREGRSYRTRSAAARGLQDPRARTLAADHVVASYAALRDPRPGVVPPDMETAFIRREKGALGNALATLARDAQFDQLAAMVRDSPSGGDPCLWWALAYVKDPRVVDLALERIGEPQSEDLDVLRALVAMKTERAEPVLRAIVARPKPRTVPMNRFTDDPDHDAPLWKSEHERWRIIIAEDGLAKLEKARAAGKSRP